MNDDELMSLRIIAHDELNAVHDESEKSLLFVFCACVSFLYSHAGPKTRKISCFFKVLNISSLHFTSPLSITYTPVIPTPSFPKRGRLTPITHHLTPNSTPRKASSEPAKRYLRVPKRYHMENEKVSYGERKGIIWGTKRAFPALRRNKCARFRRPFFLFRRPKKC